MPSMDFDFIVFHGELDTLCDPDGSRQLYEQSQVGLQLGVRMLHLLHQVMVWCWDCLNTEQWPDRCVVVDGLMQAKDKEFVLLPNMWHVLVKEEGEQKVIARVVDWLSARC